MWKMSKYGAFSGPYFPAFGLNTEIFEYGDWKHGPENTTYLDTFHTVCLGWQEFPGYFPNCFLWNIYHGLLLLFVTDSWFNSLWKMKDMIKKNRAVQAAFFVMKVSPLHNFRSCQSFLSYFMQWIKYINNGKLIIGSA